jgi:hypothetical protein
MWFLRLYWDWKSQCCISSFWCLRTTKKVEMFYEKWNMLTCILFNDVKDQSVLAGSMQKSLTRWSQLMISGIPVACMEDWYTIFNGGIRWAYLSTGNHFCAHLEVEYFLCKLASHGYFGLFVFFFVLKCANLVQTQNKCTQLVWTVTSAWDWPLYHGQAWFALSFSVTLAWKKLTNGRHKTRSRCWSST